MWMDAPIGRYTLPAGMPNPTIPQRDRIQEPDWMEIALSHPTTLRSSLPDFVSNAMHSARPEQQVRDETTRRIEMSLGPNATLPIVMSHVLPSPEQQMRIETTRMRHSPAKRPHMPSPEERIHLKTTSMQRLSAKRQRTHTAPNAMNTNTGSIPWYARHLELRKSKSTRHIFPFMQLPPELRNNIYEKALENHPVLHLSRSRTKKTLASGSSLIRASKAIRQEFLQMVVVGAPIVETTVLNYDFAHVIAFMNRMSDAELKRLEGEASTTQTEYADDMELEHPERQTETTQTDLTAPRVFRIRLSFKFGDCSDNDLTWYKQKARAGIVRWVKRFDRPNKKGHKVHVEYVNAGSAWHKWWIPAAHSRPLWWVATRALEEHETIKKALKAGKGIRLPP